MREVAKGTAGTVELLADAHAIAAEAQAQAQRALAFAGNDRLAEVFATRLAVAEGQERRLRERLEAHGAGPSRKNSRRAGGTALVTFAASRPDTPSRLIAHAFAFDHMAIAACELLGQRAEEAGDDATVAIAAAIADEERRMAKRLEESFGVAVRVGASPDSPEELDAELNRLLTEAHATEREGLHLLETTLKVVSDPALKDFFSAHLRESEEHEAMVRERLEARRLGPAKAEDAALRIIGQQVGAFFAVQPEAEARIVAFALAFEQLEIASYEMLVRAARRAGDAKVLSAAERILAEERATADRLDSISRPG